MIKHYCERCGKESKWDELVDNKFDAAPSIYGDSCKKMISICADCQKDLMRMYGIEICDACPTSNRPQPMGMAGTANKRVGKRTEGKMNPHLKGGGEVMGGKYLVINSDTGRVLGHDSTLGEAHSQGEKILISESQITHITIAEVVSDMRLHHSVICEMRRK